MSSFSDRVTSGFKNMTASFRKKHLYTNPKQIDEMDEADIIEIDDNPFNLNLSMIISMNDMIVFKLKVSLDLSLSFALNLI